MKRLMFVGVALFLVSIVWPNTYRVYAVNNGFNVITSPPTIRLQTVPGKTVTTELRIKNTSPENEMLKVGLMKFSASGDQGSPLLAERQSGDDYFDWVSFSPAKFEAPSGQWMSIKMTITVPDSAQLGYYYAVTFSRDQEQAATQKSVLVGSTATLVLLDVQTSSELRSVRLVDFSLDRKSYEFLPATFSVKLKNTGNIHLAPVGSVFISKGSKQIATINVNEAQGLILPDSTRSYDVSWSDGFPVYVDKTNDDTTVTTKNGKTVRTLKWDFSHLSKLRFGKYSAHLLMAYSDGQHDVPLEAVVSFWIIPWRIIGAGLVLLLLVVIGVWSIMRGSFLKIRSVRHRKHDA